jgi:transaldolase
MSPIATIMIGRLDDWMKILVERDDLAVHPDAPNWAGVADFKRAYAIFRERGYRARLLAAAFRHHMHWSELIGGDLSMTIPYEWQLLFNNSDIAVTPRMQNPVPKEAYDALYQKFADFRRAIEPDGMTVEEFDGYGSTVRTLRAFTTSWHDLVNLIRDFMLPNPDVK